MRRTRLVFCAALIALAACEAVPKDPEKTLESVRGNVLRVGVTEHPPWMKRGPGGEPAGVEPDLVRALAAGLDARVQWHWGQLEEHLEAVEHLQLDLAIGGITNATPWKTRVALAQPWVEVPWVVALPPGAPRIQSIEGLPVGWKPPAAIAAILKKRGATPVEVSDLAAHDGPVAAPIWWVEGHGWTHSGIVLRRDRHTMALPPGENRWITTVERHLLDSAQPTWERLRKEPLE